MAYVFPSIQVDDLLFGDGINLRTPVLVATTAAGTLVSSFENGDTVDGITLSTGDRILIKDQTSGTENGVYTVNVSGAPTRAEDLIIGDSANLYYVWIQRGTVNASTSWVCYNTPGSDVVGTDALLFTKAGGAGSVSLGTGAMGIDNRVVRFDGTDGSIQESVVTLTDLGNFTGVGDITFDEVTNDVTLAATDQATGTATLSIPDMGGVNADIVTTNTTQTVSNKRLDNPEIVNNIDFVEATNTLVMAVTDQVTAPATATIPDLGGVSQDFVFTIEAQTLQNKRLDNPEIVNNVEFVEGTNNLTLTTADQVTSASTANIPDLGGTTQDFIFTTQMQTMSNKTLVSPIVQGNVVFDEATNDLTLAVTDQATGPATATIPDLGGVSQDFLFTALMQTITNKTFGDNLNMNSNKIINLAAPTSATDAVNKSYVDSISSGLDPKESVRCATTAALSGASIVYTVGSPDTLTGVPTSIDGVTLVIGNRVLIKNQGAAEVSTVDTAGATAGLVGGEYFNLYSAKDVTTYYVWMDTNGDATTQDPAPGGTGIPVDISALTLPDDTGVASAIQAAINPQVDFNAGVVSTLVTITNAASGLTTDTSDNDTGFAFATTTQGSDARQNGIYEVTAIPSTVDLERAPDQDGTPTNEVSAGNFTFVEQGTLNQDTGWVVQGDGILTLNTDDISWVQFSGAGSVIAGDGLTRTVNTLDVNTTGISTGISGGNDVIVRSTSTAGQVLRSTGTAGVEATWGQLNLSSSDAVTGTLTVPNGGTGATTFTSGDLLQGNGTSAITSSGISTSDIVTETGTQTLTNKSLVDATTTIIDDVDNTKGLQFQVATVTTGQTRVLSVPDTNTTIVGTDATQTLSNKTLTTPRFVDLGYIADSTGAEMLIFDQNTTAVNNFQISNAASGNNPTLSAVGNDTDIGMDLQLKGTGKLNFQGTSTAAAEVRLFENTANGTDYVGLKAPTSLASPWTLTLPTSAGSSGYVLQTDGTGITSWVASAASRVSYSLLTAQVNVNSTSPTIVAYHPWDNSEYSGLGSTVTCIFWHTDVSNRDLTVTLHDGTSSIGTVTVSSPAADGIATFSVTKPTADKRLELRVSKSATGGTSPQIFGVNLEFV